VFQHPAPPPYIEGRNQHYTYAKSPRPVPDTPPSVSAQASADPRQGEGRWCCNALCCTLLYCTALRCTVLIDNTFIQRDEYDELIEKSKLSENVFASLLRFKAKAFPTPFNVQFLSQVGNKIRVSDGRKIKVLQISSKYMYLFELDLLDEFDVITINEVKRVSHFELFVDNISIDHNVQVKALIGNPSAYRLE
jgi:hypothetical protein